MKKLSLIMCILLLPNISYSIATAPSPLINAVDGTFNHGNYITVKGSGFGIKSPAKPTVWAPFEGREVAADPSLSSGSLNHERYAIDTTNQYNSSSKYNVSNIANTNGAKTAGIVSTPISTGKYFVFMRRKFPATLWKNVSNLKTFWSWPSKGFYVNMIFDYMNGRMNFSFQGGNNGGAQVMEGPSNLIDDGSWVTWEIQENKGTVDHWDGSLKWWENSILKFNASVMNVTSESPYNTYSGMVIQDFWTESVPGLGYINNAKDYLDDIYMDDTWSRVMIGNATTFSACSHREPLIPTAWSDSSITAYFNQGSFTNGSKVYLFVIDSNGNASSGKEINIGGTASGEIKPNPTTTPMPPMNLIIK